MLRLLTLLAEAPRGLRADEVAERLGKSTSTAYSLLDTLCREGFVVHGDAGCYRLTADASALVPDAPSTGRLPTSLAGVVDELFARTHKRVYLAAAQSGDVVIPLARGRQGMPRIPGLGARIDDNAHALALGKIALSLLDERALDRYIARGLQTFTPKTITSGERLREQLAEIRAGVVAFDREEFREDFCCLAVPVRNGHGQAIAALGISMSARCFEVEREALSATLCDVALQASLGLSVTAGPVEVPAVPKSEVPAISENAGVLEHHLGPNLISASSAGQTDISIGEEVAS